MIQVFSKSFGKVGFFGVRVYAELDRTESLRVDTFSGLSESSSVGTLFSSRSTDSWMSAIWEVVFGVGEIGVTRWLEKPPVPSAVQAQEPKARVVPSGTLLASLDPAIKFADELAESPTWRASCRCLPPSLLRDTLSSKVCR